MINLPFTYHYNIILSAEDRTDCGHALSAVLVVACGDYKLHVASHERSVYSGGGIHLFTGKLKSRSLVPVVFENQVHDLFTLPLPASFGPLV